MNLYPDILFHFTRNESNLYEILNHTFKVSYAREKIIGPTQTKEFAVPMVSFCDLKLSELKRFTEQYGTFGIGLTKSWAARMGLTPIMYVSKESEVADKLITGIKTYFNHIDRIDDQKSLNDLTTSYHSILNILRFIKNYEADLYRHGVLFQENYRFANEREWRHVPSIDLDFIDVPPFVDIDKIRGDAKKLMYNNKIDYLRLSFQPDDIKYLIVESEAHIDGLIRHLPIAKAGFDAQTVKRLASRILTVEQIKTDV